MSSLSSLGKRKNDSINIISSPPIKKPKLNNYINSLDDIIVSISTYSSLFCSDDENGFTMCIGNDKNVYSFGNSIYGSFNFVNENIFPPKRINGLCNIKMISCGDYHSICLDFDGNVFSFGRNTYGQLGIGENKFIRESATTPQKVDICTIRDIECGAYFCICVSDDGFLYVFGDNDYGQLGLGDKKKVYLPTILPLKNIELVSCGGYHVICKSYNNKCYSWGYNKDGQLGQGNNNEMIIPNECKLWPANIMNIKCGDHHTLLLTSFGVVYSFGRNNYGQLGLFYNTIHSTNIPTIIYEIPQIQRIECGYYHSMCIDIDNNLWIFGYNEYGQLGLGDKETQHQPIKHPTLSNIIDISSGGLHTFVKNMDSKIYAFGFNKNIQLGIETETYQISPIQTLKGLENIWCSHLGKSKQKSARK